MKIAIVGHMGNEFVGGIETYHRILFENWKGKHEITMFPTFDGKTTRIPVTKTNKWVKEDWSLLGWKPHNVVYAGTFTKKNFHKVYDNHDVVLLSCPQLPKKWISNPKSIIVQHMDKTWYKIGGKPFVWSLGQAFGSTFFGAGTWTNSFKKADNIVFYAKEGEAVHNASNVGFAALPYKKLKDIKLNNNKRSGFVWLARLDQHEKNVKFAVQLANQNDDVKIYGAGPAQPIVDKRLKDKSKFMGKANRTEIDGIMNKARAFLLTSSFEGFGFTVSEALSNGTPAIMFDNFDMAKFFNKSDAVILVEPGNYKAYQEAVDRIRDMDDKEYRILQKNAIKFSKEWISKESFWKEWDKVIKKTND